MKKTWLIMLLILMLAASALAAEWPEGLSPQKPYTGSPEVDFKETFGYMLTLPMNGKTALPGTTQLILLTPRTDVIIGKGTVSLYDKEIGLVEAVEVNEENITSRPLKESELNAVMWGSGMAFEIHLQNPMLPNRSYFVEVSEGCLTSKEFKKGSWPIAGDSKWAFTTEIGSYVDTLVYVEPSEVDEDGEKESEDKEVETVYPGDQAKLNIVLEDKYSAALYCTSGKAIMQDNYLEASGELKFTFPEAGEVNWGVVFIDPDGNSVYSLDYTTTVEPKTTEETEH